MATAGVEIPRVSLNQGKLAFYNAEKKDLSPLLLLFWKVLFSLYFNFLLLPVNPSTKSNGVYTWDISLFLDLYKIPRLLSRKLLFDDNVMTSSPVPEKIGREWHLKYKCAQFVLFHTSFLYKQLQLGESGW